MAKKKNLTQMEEEILRFLRQAFSLPPHKLKDELLKFLIILKQFEKNRFQTRVFAYLDIISWVESKVLNKPVSMIIAEKYVTDKRAIVNA
jgi:hypothetical protein